MIEWIDSGTVRPYKCFTDTVEFTSVLYKSFCMLSLLCHYYQLRNSSARTLAYLLYCHDDRAQRRHIHPIPPHYIRKVILLIIIKLIKSFRKMLIRSRLQLIRKVQISHNYKYGSQSLLLQL
jgi:hypothetical protein